MAAGRHVEQHAACIDESDLLAVPREGHRLALDNIDANLIGKQAHDRGLLNPGNRFKLLAALVQRNKKNVAANVFSEDWKQLRARDLSESRWPECGLRRQCGSARRAAR